jgi:phosphatidylglycerol:prolipoprotein diacylglycerol transferase
VAVCIVLVYIARRWGERLLKGEILCAYLIMYPIGRILMEFVRLDSLTAGGVPIATWVSIGLIVLSVAVILFRRLVIKEQPSPWTSELKQAES